MGQRTLILSSIFPIALAGGILAGMTQVAAPAQASGDRSSSVAGHLTPFAQAISRGPLPDEIGTLAALLPAGPYLYASYQTPDGETHWGVTLKADLTPGETQRVIRYGAVDGFESRRLDRHFERLYFVRFEEMEPSGVPIP